MSDGAWYLLAIIGAVIFIVSVAVLIGRAQERGWWWWT